MSTSEAPPRASLSHLGSYVRDLDAQADFCKRVFRLVETHRGVSGAGDPIVIFTEDSAEHHPLVLTAGLPVSHGNAWSINLLDPEANDVERYASSPRYVPQPFWVPIDLSRPVDELLSETQDSVEDYAGFSPFEEWARRLDHTLQSALAQPLAHQDLP